MDKSLVNRMYVVCILEMQGTIEHSVLELQGKLNSNAIDARGCIE
jgi:hypothetical protein